MVVILCKAGRCPRGMMARSFLRISGQPQSGANRDKYSFVRLSGQPQALRAVGNGEHYSTLPLRVPALGSLHPVPLIRPSRGSVSLSGNVAAEPRCSRLGLACCSQGHPHGTLSHSLSPFAPPASKPPVWLRSQPASHPPFPARPFSSIHLARDY